VFGTIFRGNVGPLTINQNVNKHTLFSSNFYVRVCVCVYIIFWIPKLSTVVIIYAFLK